MSPRPRKATDDEIFAAAHRVMLRAGPAELTLAEIGAEAGLTAGALVQRFGSKLGLLRALMAAWSGEGPRMFEALRARHRSPLAAVRDYADCVAQMGDSPGGLAHHLSWLQLDLTDPEMHAHLRTQSEAGLDSLRALLDEAVAKRELRRGTDTRVLARAVQVAATGSLMTSAALGEPVRSAMRKDVDVVLAPHLPPRRPGPGRWKSS